MVQERDEHVCHGPGPWWTGLSPCPYTGAWGLPILVEQQTWLLSKSCARASCETCFGFSVGPPLVTWHLGYLVGARDVTCSQEPILQTLRITEPEKFWGWTRVRKERGQGDLSLEKSKAETHPSQRPRPWLPSYILAGVRRTCR